MLRGAAGKVMWVGRATVFLVGLAVILALLFGVASTALAHKADRGLFHLGHTNAGKALSTLVGTLATPVLKVDNNGTGPALQLEAGNAAGAEPGTVAPITVNPEAGTATGLSADELDGKDSDEILPLVRAQRDNNPGLTSTIQDSSSAQMNTVSITAPAAGFFVISSSVDISHYGSSTDTQNFNVYTKLDGTSVSAARLDVSPNAKNENVSPHTTVPASAGAHTITLEADRFGNGSWVFNRNNLSVTFVPASRGDVTNVPSGG